MRLLDLMLRILLVAGQKWWCEPNIFVKAMVVDTNEEVIERNLRMKILASEEETGIRSMFGQKSEAVPLNDIIEALESWILQCFEF